MVVLAVSVAIGGALLLIIYVITPPIMGQLPADLRASCSAYARTAATCSLTDGTYVLYQLFGTDLEARKDVVKENEPKSNCPTSAPAAGNTVVCRYAVGRGRVQSHSASVPTGLRGPLDSRLPSPAARRNNDEEHHCAGLGKPPIQLDATRRDALSPEVYR